LSTFCFKIIVYFYSGSYFGGSLFKGSFSEEFILGVSLIGEGSSIVTFSSRAGCVKVSIILSIMAGYGDPKLLSIVVTVSKISPPLGNVIFAYFFSTGCSGLSLKVSSYSPGPPASESSSKLTSL
jgi:hypothetical protein